MGAVWPYCCLEHDGSCIVLAFWFKRLILWLRSVFDFKYMYIIETNPWELR